MTVFKRKRIVSMLLFAFAALAVSLACSITTNAPIVSQNEGTATRRTTRVARATFTPRPQVTDTAIPEPTEEPTDEPVVEPTDVPVTVAPTKRPVQPTARPVQATKPPQPTAPPPPPPPTNNPYPFGFVSHTCAHSGGSHIFIVVF